MSFNNRRRDHSDTAYVIKTLKTNKGVSLLNVRGCTLDASTSPQHIYDLTGIYDKNFLESFFLNPRLGFNSIAQECLI